MNTIIRYTTVVAIVLAASVVLMVCGQGLCESCAHACLARVDRADRLRRTIARVLDRMVSALRLTFTALVIEPARSVHLVSPLGESLSGPRTPLLI